MELKVTKEKILEAVRTCSQAKAVFEMLFPEAFQDRKLKRGDIVKTKAGVIGAVLGYADDKETVECVKLLLGCHIPAFRNRNVIYILNQQQGTPYSVHDDDCLLLADASWK